MLNATSTIIFKGAMASSTFLMMANSHWFPVIAMLLALWVIPWKGYALWRAAKNGHKGWFIALLLINTLAILEIIYIFAVDRRNKNRQS